MVALVILILGPPTTDAVAYVVFQGVGPVVPNETLDESKFMNGRPRLIL